LSEKQKTLKQKFEEVCKAYATSEEKNYLYYEAVKEWLQQKQGSDRSVLQMALLDELLEELEKKEKQTT